MNKNIKLLFAHKALYDVYFFGAITIPFFVGKGYGVTTALLFASMYMLLSMVMEVPTGIVGDRYGHKKSVLLGTFMTGVSFFSLILVDNIIWDMVWITVFAASSALNSGSDTAMIRAASDDFEKDNRTFDYLKSVMLLVSFAGAGFIVNSSSLDFAIGFSGALAIAAVVPLLFVAVPAKNKVNTKYTSIIAQVKDLPTALRKVDGGLSLIILAGLVGAVTFSAKEIISALNTVYDVDIALIGIIAAMAMAGRIIGTILEKRVQASYRVLLLILAVLVSATAVIDINNTLGIILILSSTVIAQMLFYRLKYKLSYQAPETHVASLVSGLSLVGRSASGGIILLVAGFTSLGYFYLSFVGIAVVLTVVGGFLTTRITQAR